MGNYVKWTKENIIFLQHFYVKKLKNINFHEFFNSEIDDFLHIFEDFLMKITFSNAKNRVDNV